MKHIRVFSGVSDHSDIRKLQADLQSSSVCINI